MDNSISEISVAFEPNEITARSSGVSIGAKRQFALNESFHGINLSKRQRLRETAKISDEESQSGSIVDAELTDNEPDDIYENSVIGLTTIINTLQDVVSKTRRLVNQLNAQKKKNPVIQDNARKETYTLPCNKESMMPTTNCNKFDEDINLKKLSTIPNKVVVATDNLYTCIVGMTREVNVELRNIGDRWITYTFQLIDVGLQENIELNIPTEKMFLEPNRTQSTKIGVKVIKMCNAIRVTLHIVLSDIISKSTKWSMEHTIVVNPVQLDTVLLRKEVPLCAQEDSIKIQIRDTGIYIIEPTRQGKSFSIINIGNFATKMSITILPMEGYGNMAKDFYIHPNEMFLQIGEKKACLIGYILPFRNNAEPSADIDKCAKIKIVAGNDVHQFIINTEVLQTMVCILNCKEINSL